MLTSEQRRDAESAIARLIYTYCHRLDGADLAGAAALFARAMGYALGTFLIVPLGDVLDRKRMIAVILGLFALALLGASVAPTFALLLAALVIWVSTRSDALVDQN